MNPRTRTQALRHSSTREPRSTPRASRRHPPVHAVTHHLERFIEAQQTVYDQALAEIRSGLKQTHWMWFVFPQFDGLGLSAMSRRYAVKSLDEARAYLSHPLLGPRLLECAEAVLGVESRSAEDIFGSPDDMKLRSSATLFAQVSANGSVFHRILDKYFHGRHDQRTIALTTTPPASE